MITLAIDRHTQTEKKTDYVRVTLFGKNAENVGRYKVKGDQLAIEGRIQTDSYENRDGKTVYTTNVIAERVEFLGSRGQQQQGQTPQYNNAQYTQYQPTQRRNTGLDDSESYEQIGYTQVTDDIPF